MAIKQEVLRRISASPESRYRADNVWIAGTHTHSAMGGYSHYFLYNAAGFGFDPHVFESAVNGIVRAIETAHERLGPGRVRVSKGKMEPPITANRSLAAFANNPDSETDLFKRGVDDFMTLLAFDRMDAKGHFETVGALSWFAIHPTHLGKASGLVSGDNKGYAAHRLEVDQRTAGRAEFIAGFANSCAGDVSGNVERSERTHILAVRWEEPGCRARPDARRGRRADGAC